jgi:hypothetical protein
MAEEAAFVAQEFVSSQSGRGPLDLERVENESSFGALPSSFLPLSSVSTWNDG